MRVFFFQIIQHAMSKMSLLLDAASFLAQTAAPATPGAPGAGPQGGMGFMLVVYGLMAAGFYFLLIAPQRKKQKEHEKLIAALQSGDEIVTNGGIFGVITNVKEDRFVVRIADNTKIELGKGFVTTVVKRAGTEK
jgi:preprotein translocase subunit YajC